MSKPFDRSYTIIPNLYYQGYYPGGSTKARTLEKLQRIYDCGIRQIVNLTEADEIKVDGTPLEQYQSVLEEFNSDKEDKLLHKRFPIEDMNVTTVEQMKDTLDFIDACIEKKIPVYAGCVGNYGRGGTLFCCWLIRHGKADKSNVFDILLDYRKEDVTWRRPSPQREVQRQFVLNWKKGM
ncbi:MAG: hypothetical protein N4A35_15175 [Flavobacteriales bacterium]|jgi:hypothetical protein|nr:hypothetical protein [Flavobacteriales bacterium]